MTDLKDISKCKYICRIYISIDGTLHCECRKILYNDKTTVVFKIGGNEKISLAYLNQEFIVLSSTVNYEQQVIDTITEYIKNMDKCFSYTVEGVSTALKSFPTLCLYSDNKNNILEIVRRFKANYMKNFTEDEVIHGFSICPKDLFTSKQIKEFIFKYKLANMLKP